MIKFIKDQMDDKKNYLNIFQWASMGILCILILLLLFQNLKYRKILKAKNIQISKYVRKLSALAFEKDLKSNFLFKRLPFDIRDNDVKMFPADKKVPFQDYLIMIFDLTVCGKCLHQELEVLQEFKDIVENKNIFLLAIVGITNKNEESQVIELYRSGELFFPFITKKVDLVYDRLKLDRDKYIDTPIFLYTSHDFKIKDIFKPVYLDTKEFKLWLEIILL